MWATLFVISRDLCYISFLMIQSLARSTLKVFFPARPKSLKNEVILVTGGSSGIGRGLLTELALIERDLTLISWDVDVEGNQKTVEMLRKLGVKRAVGYTVDVGNKEAVKLVASKVREDVGNPTMIFNNAGICGPIAKTWEMNLDLAHKAFDVNLFSHWYILQQFLPHMLRNKSGHVIATCSFAGYTSIKDTMPYLASKHAVKGCYEGLKEDLRAAGCDGVKVSIVYPGWIATNFTATFDFSAKLLSPLVKPTSPQAAAREILEGVRRNHEHIYVPQFLRAFHVIVSLCSPDLYRTMLDAMEIDPFKKAYARGS